MAVANHLTRPTRSSGDPGRVSLLIWPCSDWGLPCHACCQARGGLLPHRFTLTLGQRAVCFLWPFPSPHGAQVLPGSLPSGARTFLSTPLQPACGDHHALPPPGRKTTGYGRVRASLAHEPPQQAAQAVGLQAPAGAWPGGLLWRDPEAVTFVAGHPLDPRPVACSERQRNERYRG